MKSKSIPMLGLTALLAGLSLAIGLNGCSATQSPQTPGVEASGAGADLSGLWTGSTRVTPCFTGAAANAGPRCNAINNISFSLVQQGSQLSGSYTCSTGTYICRNGGADDSGKVTSGKVSDGQVSLQVTIPADVSNCYYTGSSSSPRTLSGTYTCYNGGQFIEQGMWQVSRQ
jgi:hypothetical protein